MKKVGLFVSWLVGLLILVGCIGVQTVEYEPVLGTPADVQTVVSPTELSPTATLMLATAVFPTNELTIQPTNQPPATSIQLPAANADVIFVRAVQTGAGIWTFHVTVEHPDTGWEDYADGWDVILPDGSVVLPNPDAPFTRLLLHPHETEQPFTRSQGNIAIPPDVTNVTVRAHDLVDGFGGKEVVVDLTAVSGPDFGVEK